MLENGANIQKNYVARVKQNKKMGFTFMDLVKQICHRGGNRTKRPLHIKPSHGGELWWRWVQGGDDLWKLLWEKKYEIVRTPEGKL